MFDQLNCTVDKERIVDCKTCLCKSSVFRHLSDEELEKVDNTRFQVKYEPGEVIFKKGTAITHSISFTTGIAKLYDELRNDQIILRIIKPTELISGYGLLYNKVHHYSVTAITESSACFIDIDVIKSFLVSNNKFMEEFVNEIQGYNFLIQNRLIDLLSKRTAGRIAGTLLYLGTQIYKSWKFELDFNKGDLRKLSVVSSDSLSRTLNQFQSGDLVKFKGRSIEILNPVMLEKIWLNG